jgi:hypothetical protein
MKLHSFLTFIFLAIPFLAIAQNEEKKYNPVRLALGANLGVYNTATNNDVVNYPDLINGSLSVFARAHITNHLAVEAAFRYSISEKDYSYQDGMYKDQYGNFHSYFTNDGVRSQSKYLPVNLQYHVGKKDAALRAYTSLGIGFLPELSDQPDYKHR